MRMSFCDERYEILDLYEMYSIGVMSETALKQFLHTF